jgi:3-hydroxyisobutyrate dehydrogenase
MVGGTPAGFARAQPVLACMGKNLVHCGASGTGQVGTRRGVMVVVSAGGSLHLMARLAGSQGL